MSISRKNISINKSWNTPIKFIEPIQKFFGGSIELDPCSNEFSLVSTIIEYKLPNQDGLIESWNYSNIFLNPPYGTDKERKTSIKMWLDKVAETYKKYSNEIICLIPVATNTKNWKENIFPIATSICFYQIVE
jgi:hypothetical protein